MNRVIPIALLALSFCTAACEPGRVAQGRVLHVLPEGRYPERPSDEPASVVAFVKVANTPAARERGLMYTKSLAPNRGMLFIYPVPQLLSFWMKNVEMPLSICFADASGRIVRILEMETAPGVEFPLERYESLLPAIYALEMNRGWFTEKGIQVGDELRLHPEIKALPVR